MKTLLMLALSLGFVAVISGCHAEGDVGHPNGASSVVVPQ